MTPKVGQTLYRHEIGSDKPLIPVVVTKVGRKYFSCKEENGWHDRKYWLNTWRENAGPYLHRYRLFANPQDWEDEKETSRIRTMLREFFQGYGYYPALTLDQLRAIEKIVKEGIND